MGEAEIEGYGAIVRCIHEEAEFQRDLAVVDACDALSFRDERHPDRGTGPDGVEQHIAHLLKVFPTCGWRSRT